jgi:glycosyltransferase involved in cell wall biosynthesis
MLTNALAPDKLGGLERYVRELGAALVREGVDVTVLAKQVDPALPAAEVGDDGVRILRHRMPPRTSRSYALRAAWSASDAARRELRRGHAVVHAHYPVPALPLAVSDVPYLYTFHAPVHRELLAERLDSYFLPSPVQPTAVAAFRRLERLVVSRAAQVVVLSEFMRSELRALSAEQASKAELVPGGIDRSRFAPGPGLEDPWARAAHPLLFCARRLTSRTGVRELVRGMPEILRALPRARLAVAGEGRMAAVIEREARELRLDDVVRLLGRIPDEELVNWYRAADVTVVPTQALEGFGLATAESLACGTPVVGTPVGATPELLAPLDPGLIARSASPSAIATAVVAAVADPDRLATLSGRARAGTVRLGWEAVVQRYLAAYERILTTGAARRSGSRSTS